MKAGKGEEKARATNRATGAIMSPVSLPQDALFNILYVLVTVAFLALVLFIAATARIDQTMRLARTALNKVKTFQRTRGDRVTVLLRSGRILTRTVGKLTASGELITPTRLYKLPPLEPYIFCKDSNCRRAEPVIIVDADRNIVYEFEDPDDEEIQQELRKAKIGPSMIHPIVLKNYFASRTIEKLVGKMQPTRGEQIVMLLVGMTLAFIMEFFILPMLGYHVSISPAR